MPPRARSGLADIRHAAHLATVAHRGARIDIVGTRHDPHGEPLPPNGTAATFPIVSGVASQGRLPKGWVRNGLTVEHKAPILDVEGFENAVARAVHRAVEAVDKMLGANIKTTITPLVPLRGEVSRHEVHIDVDGRASATHHFALRGGRGWKHEGRWWSRTSVAQHPKGPPWVESNDDARSHIAALEGALEKIVAESLGEATLTDTGIEAITSLL